MEKHLRILLIGEYSNVHNTLALGLRSLGHSVTVASNGDFWKNYHRDIDLERKEGLLSGARLSLKILLNLSRLSGYDVVQIINPMCVELKAVQNIRLLRYLKRHNKKLVLGAFGMDFYWVDICRKYKHLRYSDFNIGDELRNDENALREVADWIGTDKQRLNEMAASQCDAIVAGLYEYYSCYSLPFKEKTKFIPFPIELDINEIFVPTGEKLKVFIGINKSRSRYKGTDIMLSAAQRLQNDLPESMELRVACSLPFDEYRRQMLGSDVILDQLYSYTPAMNALEAMSHGIVCVGGGEPENYEILGETELRPIVNVLPNEQDVYDKLKGLLRRPAYVDYLKRQSMEYVRRHHDHIKVARLYEKMYNSLF